MAKSTTSRAKQGPATGGRTLRSTGQFNNAEVRGKLNTSEKMSSDAIQKKSAFIIGKGYKIPTNQGSFGDFDFTHYEDSLE